jgi:hypothetical protein
MILKVTLRSSARLAPGNHSEGIFRFSCPLALAWRWRWTVSFRCRRIFFEKTQNIKHQTSVICDL